MRIQVDALYQSSPLLNLQICKLHTTPTHAKSNIFESCVWILKLNQPKFRVAVIVYQEAAAHNFAAG